MKLTTYVAYLASAFAVGAFAGVIGMAITTVPRGAALFLFALAPLAADAVPAGAEAPALAPVPVGAQASGHLPRARR